MGFVTGAAVVVDLVALDDSVGRGRPNILVVRMCGACAMTLNAADLRRKMDGRQLLIDKRHVANIATRIGAERVALVQARTATTHKQHGQTNCGDQERPPHTVSHWRSHWYSGVKLA